MRRLNFSTAVLNRFTHTSASDAFNVPKCIGRGTENPDGGIFETDSIQMKSAQTFDPEQENSTDEAWHRLCKCSSRVPSSRETKAERPLTVHLIRTAAYLSLFAGVIMLIAGNAQLGVVIVLLSALYVALAEIVNYLAIIARRPDTSQRMFEEHEQVEDLEAEYAER